MFPVELVLLSALVAAAVQDFLWGEVYDLTYFAAFVAGSIILPGVWSRYSLVLLTTGLFYIIGVPDEFGKADLYALLLIVFFETQNLVPALGVTGFLTMVYGLYLDKKEKDLRVVPGIALGYLLFLVLKFSLL